MSGRGAWAFGFDPFWWGGPGPGRRRRGRRQWFGAGDMKYVILKLLRDKPMHGYEVMKALEERSHGCYKPSPGTVYPTLQWLEDEGLVRSDERDGKKVYAITDAGRTFLDENKSTVEDIFERLEDMVDDLVGDPMPDVIREVGKLVGQVYRTAWRNRDDDDQRRRIVEILQRTREEIANMGRESKAAAESGEESP